MKFTNKKDIYLHIGLPKTGTTSIQSILFFNKNILLKNAIFYPGKFYNHANIFINKKSKKIGMPIDNSNKILQKQIEKKNK